MHVKTDSEVTSLAVSSSRSPPRPTVYYVQSPSRDSHDEEKNATSFQSTPVFSPMGSPHHSQTSVGHHSLESSSSIFNGSRKITGNHGSRHGNRRSQKPWKESDVIEEEGLLDNEEYERGHSRRYYFFAFVVGFVVLFSLFSLILWAASKPMKPDIAMKSITFERVSIQAGSDATGVAADMITMNSTVKFTYHNTGTFFGVHVTSIPVDLSYLQITIASGTVKEFHQSRKSQRSVTVSVIGNKIPLYGSGAELSTTSTGVPAMAVPVKLSFVVRSRAYVLGKFVKPKFYNTIECSVTLDPKKLNVPILLEKFCAIQ